MPTLPSPADQALLELLSALQTRDYAFVTPTPATHERVLARDGAERARTLRDVFGWSRPFEAEVVEPEILELMRRGDVLERDGGTLRSTVRVASLDGGLFLHSAFPPKAADAVFFGPDTYRFAAFLQSELEPGAGGRIVDLGAGAGAGGIVAGRLRPGAEVVLSDVNAKALRFARINAAHAGVHVETVEGAGLDPVPGPVDLVLANPPFMVSGDGRAYREGGDMHGAGLSLEWARAAADRLPPGGRLLMYTGSAIVDGHDRLRAALEGVFEPAGFDWRYREIDPDVFGEELEKPAYADVERIAIVGVAAIRRGAVASRTGGR